MMNFFSKRAAPCDHPTVVINERSPTPDDKGRINDIWIQNYPSCDGKYKDPAFLFIHNGSAWIFYFKRDVVEILTKRVMYLEEKYNEY